VKKYLGQKEVLHDSKTYVPLPLIKKTVLNHNVRIFRFGLPKDYKLGIPVGKHIRLSVDIKGEQVIRQYTPISTVDTVGYVDLLVKIYYPNEQHPEGGKMSQYLDRIDIGTEVNFSGPIGRIEHLGSGSLNISGFLSTSPVTHIHGLTQLGLMAVGTGITPMWQLIQAIFENKQDKTEIFLVYGNRHEEDILLRKEIDAMRRKHPTRLHVVFILSNPSATWEGPKGRINKELIAKSMPTRNSESLVLTCGLPAMNRDCRNHLIELGYPEKRIHQY